MRGIELFSKERALLGESPLWEPRQGALYWIDIEGRAVHMQCLAGGSTRKWALPSEPGCIARSDTGLIVAMRSGIAHLDTVSGELRKLHPAPFDPSKQRFNDGKADVQGRLWVGTIHEPRDGPHATLFRVDRLGCADQKVAVTVSNGLAFSPDARTLYHADTTAHLVRAWDFDADLGIASRPRTLRAFDATRGASYGGRPDGATVDAEGAYWVAMYEGSRLLRLSPEGEVLREIALPVICPTMPAFGGDDMRTLFITSVSARRPAQELATHPWSGHVLMLRVDVPGLIEPLCLPGSRP